MPILKGIVLVTILISTFSTCNDPDTLICLPLNIKMFSGDSLVFEIGSEKRLVSITTYRSSGVAPSRDEMVYDNAGKLATVKHYNSYSSTSSVVNITYQLEYANELVSKMTATTASSSFTSVNTYEHDGNKRLLRMTNDTNGSIRYEYNDQGNVSKVFYLLPGVTSEILAREAHTYDNRFLYYEHVPDLKLYNVYVNGFIPGNNNCLSATVQASYVNGTLVTFPTPQLVNYNITYNSQGYVTGWIPPATPFTTDTWFTDVDYSCSD